MTIPEAVAIDRHALNGKLPPAEARCDVVVIGAGPSGIAAAHAAAQAGKSVLPVDENPVPGAAQLNAIRSWAGVIEHTPDSRPIIDRMRDPENVVVATMSSVGVGLSPASGHAIAKLALSRFDALALDWAAEQGWQAVT